MPFSLVSCNAILGSDFGAPIVFYTTIHCTPSLVVCILARALESHRLSQLLGIIYVEQQHALPTEREALPEQQNPEGKIEGAAHDSHANTQYEEHHDPTSDDQHDQRVTLQSTVAERTSSADSIYFAAEEPKSVHRFAAPAMAPRERSPSLYGSSMSNHEREGSPAGSAAGTELSPSQLRSLIDKRINANSNQPDLIHHISAYPPSSPPHSDTAADALSLPFPSVYLGHLDRIHRLNQRSIIICRQAVRVSTTTYRLMRLMTVPGIRLNLLCLIN